MCDAAFSPGEVFSPSVHESHDCASVVQYINANKIDIDENGYQATYIEEKQQTGWVSRLFGGKVKARVVRIRFPGVIELEYLSDTGIEMLVVIYLIEERKDRCKLILIIFKTGTANFGVLKK